MPAHTSLTFNQRRVFGALIEKSTTTPEQYPLTVNALISACNQKSNRDPVVSLSEQDVVDALQELMHKKLVRRAETDRGARAVRYEHLAQQALGWSPREQAVLAELLLRGPQTAGELRTRSDRMHRMHDLPFVQGILTELAENDPPLVRTLPRAAGQSVVRHDHTLYMDGEAAAASSPEPAAAARTPETSSRECKPATAAAPNDTLARLIDRISALERRVAELENRESASPPQPNGPAAC